MTEQSKRPSRRLLLVLALFVPALLQGAEDTGGEAPVQLPEEIVVTGPQLFRVLEARIREAEDAMYGLFNELNGDDLYDIHCKWEAPLGTRIRQRVCRPTFVDQATEHQAKDFLGQVQGLSGTGAPPAQAVTSYHYPILEDKLKDVLQESPAFLEAVQRHHQLREALARRKAAWLAKEDE